MDTPEPSAAPDYPPPPAPRPRGRGWTIAGFVLAGFSVLLGPLAILVGPAGTACGVAGLRKGDPMGKVAALVAAGSVIVALVLFGLLAGSDPEAGSRW